MNSRLGLRKGFLGIADQIILSASSFATGLLLARELAPAGFGAYVIAFTLSLVGLSFQVGLITDPLLVFGASNKRNAPSYFAAVLRMQIVLSVALLCLLELTAVLVRWAFGGDLISHALAGAGLAILPIQLQTFFRTVFFARLKPAAVFWNDLCFSVLRVAGILLLLPGGNLTSFSAFLSIGAAALLATLVALPFCRDFLLVPGRPLRSVWKEHWEFGKWLMATSGAFWLSGQAPLILASGLLSPIAAAAIKACDHLVAPLNVLFTGLNGVTTPHVSRLHDAGETPAMRAFLRRFALAAAGIVVIYGLVLMPFTRQVLDFLYRGNYNAYSSIVGILLLDALLRALARPSILRLKVQSETRKIFFGQSLSAMCALIALFVLAPGTGVIGAAVSLPIASAAMLLYLAMTMQKSHGNATTHSAEPVGVIKS